VQNLRRWATLSVFASIDDKPPELTVTALIRGRFCELTSEHLSAVRGELFTLGMFSVIDALMDTPQHTGTQVRGALARTGASSMAARFKA
jgi:c-di-GMP phosphodiesterase